MNLQFSSIDDCFIDNYARANHDIDEATMEKRLTLDQINLSPRIRHHCRDYFFCVSSFF